MVPAGAGVHQVPNLTRAHFGGSCEAVEIRRQSLSAICLHRPRVLIRARRAPELEGAFACDRNIGEIRVWNHSVRYLAHVRLCRVAQNPELQELPYAWVWRLASERI